MWVVPFPFSLEPVPGWSSGIMLARCPFRTFVGVLANGKKSVARVEEVTNGLVVDLEIRQRNLAGDFIFAGVDFPEKLLSVAFVKDWLRITQTVNMKFSGINDGAIVWDAALRKKAQERHSASLSLRNAPEQ